jgi:hypothetical protein
MKHTNEAPKYTLRRAVAAAGVVLAAAGVAKGYGAIEANQRHVSYVQHPNTIPEDEAMKIVIKQGDTAFDVAHELSPKDANSSDLTLEIQNQADENGLLHPGQEVIVERDLLDPQKAIDLAKQQTALE